jgi:hypothetical protein
MAPVQGKGLAHWWRFPRFHIVELVGNCMAPSMTDRFAIVDRKAEIRRGDLFSFNVSDFRETFGNAAPNVTGGVKRFIGVDQDAQLLECDCTRPVYIIHMGLTKLQSAYRVRATAPSYSSAWRLMWAVWRNTSAFDRLLMPSLGTAQATRQ